MKKYLLLIEDEKLWERFKEMISKDINTEIIELIKKRIERGGIKRWKISLVKEDKWRFSL